MSEKKICKHPLGKTFLTFFLYGILYVVLVNVKGLFEGGRTFLGSTYAFSNIFDILIGILILMLYWVLHRKDLKDFFTVKKTGKGLLMGWSLLFLGFSMWFLNFIQGVPQGNVIVALIMGIAPGFCEELLFRIIPISTIKRLPAKNKKKALFITYLVSGMGFGLIHAFNVLVGADPVNTIIQVLYAVGIGLLFGGLYLITSNLWVTVILHSFLDFASLLTVSGQQTGGVLEEANNWQSNVLILIYTGLIYINAFLVWRKMKEEKIF